MTAFQPLPKYLGRVLLSGLFAASCAGAIAQTPSTAPMPPTGMRAPDAMRDSPGGHMGEAHHMGRMDPAKMQARMAKRQAEMKARLKITPEQEPAWAAFTGAMQPPAGGMGWHQSSEQMAALNKMQTPERIDKMRALRTERMTEMTEMNAMADKMGDAAKTFYATLSAEQKSIFDAEHRKLGDHEEMRHSDRMNKH